MFHVKQPLAPDPALLEVAASRPVRHVSRETSENHARGPGVMQAHLCCPRCDQSVACLSPDTTAGAYVVTSGQISAQVIAHIRQRHPESVPAT
jgi:hypothetical protein